MKGTEEKKEMMSMTDVCRFLIADIIGSGMAEIPEGFQKCMQCGQPATRIMCGNLETEDERFKSPVYADPDTADLAEYLREVTGTTIELPTCEMHEGFMSN